VRLFVAGFGNVGQGLAELIVEKRAELYRCFGLRLDVVAVADSRGCAVREDGLELAKVLNVKRSKGTVAEYPLFGRNERDMIGLIESLDADVLVEMTPTNIVDGEPGVSFIKSALCSGKHVVSTDKGPFALAYREIMQEAQRMGRKVKFSGTVGGATPMIDFARKCIMANRILGIEGILNGTTNYILTKMHEEAKPFDEALKEAQQMGIAEADPSYDVKGIDTACKLTILANSTMGRDVTIHDVEIKGIEDVTPAQVEAAKRRGRAIKLVGKVGEEMAVRPMEVPVNSSLCVNGTLNVVKYSTELAGDFFLVGKGAGGRETASAVLRDIIDISYGIGEVRV